MLDKFQEMLFSDCDLKDPFFQSLIRDYPAFPNWFNRKSLGGKKAFVYKDNDNTIRAFLYMKVENEEISLQGNQFMKAEPRIKIGTLKIDDSIQGQRLGEGAIGSALWRWRDRVYNQIYITVFEKHKTLIDLLMKFGFCYIGKNLNEENVYVKDKRSFIKDSPYTAFPYINDNYSHAGYIPIQDGFHDKLFPYSELFHTPKETFEIAAANGVTKIFIATPYSLINYEKGEPVFIYRIHSGDNKQYRSCITSYCTIVSQVVAKQNNRNLYSEADFLKIVGNKSVYGRQELLHIWNNNKNVIILTMVYNGFFGKGHNVIFKDLKDNGMFDDYPYEMKLNHKQFEQILKMGDKNVSNVIVN